MSAPVAEGEPQAIEPDAPEEERDWVFTFGSGHKLTITPAAGGMPAGAGVPLDRFYVRVHGTWMSARLRFAAVYGTAFASQYDSPEEANADLYGLTEITLPGLTS